MLKELDDVRTDGSWRNEDPDVGPVPSGQVDAVQKTLDDINAKQAAAKVKSANLSALMPPRPQRLATEVPSTARPKAQGAVAPAPVVGAAPSGAAAPGKASTRPPRQVGFNHKSFEGPQLTR